MLKVKQLRYVLTIEHKYKKQSVAKLFRHRLFFKTWDQIFLLKKVREFPLSPYLHVTSFKKHPTLLLPSNFITLAAAVSFLFLPPPQRENDKNSASDSSVNVAAASSSPFLLGRCRRGRNLNTDTFLLTSKQGRRSCVIDLLPPPPSGNLGDIAQSSKANSGENISLAKQRIDTCKLAFKFIRY